MIEKLMQTVGEVCAYQRDAAMGASVNYTTKSGPLDFVSEVDTRSQQMLVQAIEREFPDAGIVAEEEGPDLERGQPELVFVIDPVDGTGNFISRLPCWGISIGLLRDGMVAEGIVALPASNEIYISTDFPQPELFAAGLDEVRYTGLNSEYRIGELGRNLPGKRRLLGATAPTTLFCALPSLFMGRPSLDLALFGPVRLWDIAGGAAFVAACGGAVIDLDGRDVSRTNLFDLYGGMSGLAQARVSCAVAGRADLAREAVNAGLLEPARGA